MFGVVSVRDIHADIRQPLHQRLIGGGGSSREQVLYARPAGREMPENETPIIFIVLFFGSVSPRTDRRRAIPCAPSSARHRARCVHNVPTHFSPQEGDATPATSGHVHHFARGSDLNLASNFHASKRKNSMDKAKSVDHFLLTHPATRKTS